VVRENREIRQSARAMIKYSTPQLEKATRLRKAAAQLCDGNYISAKIYDRTEIARLLGQGISIRQIARIIGCSTWPVQIVRKQMKNGGLTTDV
jgi:uncharacterized protein YerC